MTGPVTVVIAEDHYLFREGTRRLLEASPNVSVVASVEDGATLLEAVERLKPDAVVVDIRMPPSHTTEGIHAARQLRASHPSTGVVVLSQTLPPSTPSNCSRTAPPGSPTCSKTESATSTNYSEPSTPSPKANRSSTRRWWTVSSPSAVRPPTPGSTTSRRERKT